MSLESRERAREKGQKSGKGTEPLSKMWVTLWTLGVLGIAFLSRLLGLGEDEESDNGEGR